MTIFSPKGIPVRLVGRSLIPEDGQGNPLCTVVHKGSVFLAEPDRRCPSRAVALYHHKKSGEAVARCPAHDFTRHAHIWALVEPSYRREVVDADLDARLSRDDKEMAP